MADKKNPKEDLNDMLGDAKEGAKKAAGKAEDFADEAKEKAQEVFEDVKETASEFAEDAKQVLSDGKNVAIIAHLTLIGWIIALIMNSNKNEFASFYIRQMLGLMIVAFLLSFVPMLGWILNLGMLALWIISLIGAFEGQKKLVPIFGEYFQDWFKSV
jgi:uncharacterized membrane protein/uncharacterized protein YjbJ (UPF0337 family)